MITYLFTKCRPLALKSGFAAVVAVVLLCGCSGGPQIAGAPPSQNNPLPSISSVTPSVGAVGSGGMTVTVKGSNLVNGSVVQLNGTSLSTNFVSSSQMTALIPANALLSPGTSQVQVVNPAPGGGASNIVNFMIQNGIPAVASLSPTTVPAGVAPITLHVTGSLFVPGATVKWNSQALSTTVISNSELAATVPSGMLRKAGIAQVTIENPAPGGGVSPPILFSVASTVVRFAYVTHYTKGAVSMHVADAATGELRPNGYVMVGSLPTYLTTDLSQKYLYVSNYGSNNISAFRMESSGKLTEVSGSPFAAGTGPLVPRVDPSNNFLLVANWDSSDITVFQIDSMTGALTPVAGSPFSTQGTLPDDLQFDPMGKFLFVTNFGSDNVAAFDFAAATGVLSPVMNSPFASGAFPTGIGVHPSGNHLYVTHNDQAGTISRFSIDSMSGALTAVGTPVAAGDYPTFIRISPDGKFAYAANIESHDISGYSVDPADGSLTPLPGSPFFVGPNLLPMDIQIDNSGQRIYASSFQLSSTVVTAFDIDPSTGALAVAGQTRTMDRAMGIGLMEDTLPASFVPEFAYVTNTSGNSLAAFRIDAPTGGLTSIGSFATESSPASAVAHPSGKYVYVPNTGSNTISSFSVDATTGALTPIGAAVPAGTSPGSAVIEPSGRFLYVVNSGSNTISKYNIDSATGALSADGTVPTGSAPASISIDPTVRWAWVTNPGSNDIRLYAINLVTGALTFRATLPVGAVAPAAAAADVKGRSLNVIHGSQLRSYGIYMPDGSLLGNGGSSAVGSGPVAIALDPSGVFLYVAGANSNEITAFRLDSTSAAPTLIGSASTAVNPVSLAVDPSGAYLYVAAKGASQVQVFTIDSSSGLLTSSGAVPASTPEFVIVSGKIQ